jgi:hypothetical protein
MVNCETDLEVGGKLQTFVGPKGLIRGLYRQTKVQHEKAMLGVWTHILMERYLGLPKL